jgi:hypothetical protein
MPGRLASSSRLSSARSPRRLSRAHGWPAKAAPQFGETLVVPLRVDVRQWADLLPCLVEGRQAMQQFGAKFVEEHPDDHVEFAPYGHPLAAGQQLMDDERHQQHLDRHEGNIVEQVQEDEADIVKQHEMQQVQQGR